MREGVHHAEGSRERERGSAGKRRSAPQPDSPRQRRASGEAAEGQARARARRSLKLCGFVSVASFLVAMWVAGSARAEGLSTSSLAGAGTVVVSATPDAASVAVCLSPLGAEEPDAARNARIDERGGVTSYAEVDGLGIWCAAVAPSELAYALWVSAHALRDRKEQTAPEPVLEPSLARAAAIALEGGATAESPASPAYTVVIAGRVETTDAMELVQRYFSVKPGDAAPPRPAPWKPVQSSERMSAMQADVHLPRARYAFITPEGSADEAGIRVALEVLGGGAHARLPRLLVDGGLAREVAAWSLHLPGGTLSGLVVEPTSRVSIDRLRRFVDGALKQLRLVGPSRRELTRAKQRLLLSYYRDAEDPLSRARLLASYEMSRGGAERAARDAAAIDATTVSSVREAVRHGLGDARRTTIETYPPSFPADDPHTAHQRLYTVGESDTLEGIAARFHVPVTTIARANDLDPRYRLTPGQPLWIPRE